MQLNSISELEQILREALAIARQQVPIDKGNMRYNSIKLKRVGDLDWEIYLDLDIAQYAKFVNERIPSHHTPKQLANEYFWDRFCKVFMRTLNRRLGGKLVNNPKKKTEKKQ